MKRLINLTFMCLMTFVLFITVGCSSDNPTVTTNETSATSTQGTDKTTESTPTVDLNKVTYPVTVKDQAERDVVIESEPTKIISGYYISSSILLALGEGENIVGLENLQKGMTSRPIYDLTGFTEKNIMGYGTKKAFESEKAALLSPDLIVIPYSLKGQADTISTVCASPVIVVNPESDELMNETLDILSTATNSKARANEYKEFVSNSLKDIKKVSSNNKAYFVSAGASVLETLTGKSYQTTMLSNCGLENVCKDLEGSSAEISYEQLLAYNPDYIIIAAESSLTVEAVMGDTQLSSLNAVVNNNVYKIPGNIEAWDSPIPAVFLGSLYISSKTTDYSSFNDVAKSFYKTFYGIEITL